MTPERQRASDLLAGFTACPIYGPGQELIWPSPSNDSSAPASVVAWDLTYDGVEQADFAGGKEARGSIDFSIWQEGESDTVIAARIEALEALFTGVDTAGLHWRPGVQGDFEREDAWYGRLLSIPFVRFS